MIKPLGHVGGRLVFGETEPRPAVCVTTRDVRCVMINLDPDTGKRDGQMLKAAVRLNGNNAGVYGTVGANGHDPRWPSGEFRLGHNALKPDACRVEIRLPFGLHLRPYTTRMRAAVLYGKEDVRIEEVAPKALQPGEVRIEIGAALTCGTDLKVFKRGYHARMIVPPALFGHELAGRIVEVRRPGSKETKALGESKEEIWKTGDRVVVANSAPCGRCLYCKNGQENLCDDLIFLNGAYAESIVVPQRLVRKNMVRLSAATSLCDAALVEPLACVVQGIEDARLKPGQRVLVIGAGPIGLMFVALGKHQGCSMAVAGRGGARLETARRLGAMQLFDMTGRNDLIATLPRDLSFDVVIEAVGKPETWEAAVRLVRKGGVVNFFGGCPSGTTVSLDTSLIHYSNLTLLASFHHTPRTIRRALEFIEKGVVSAADFVDGECPLSELPALLRSMASGNRSVKTLIRVNK